MKNLGFKIENNKNDEDKVKFKDPRHHEVIKCLFVVSLIFYPAFSIVNRIYLGFSINTPRYIEFLLIQPCLFSLVVCGAYALLRRENQAALFMSIY